MSRIKLKLISSSSIVTNSKNYKRNKFYEFKFVKIVQIITATY